MTTLDDWTRLAGEITPRTEIFIDGKYRAAVSGATFDSINPATGELIAPVSAGDAEDATKLFFDHPGITAKHVKDRKFAVTVATEVPEATTEPCGMSARSTRPLAGARIAPCPAIAALAERCSRAARSCASADRAPARA